MKRVGRAGMPSIRLQGPAGGRRGSSWRPARSPPLPVRASGTRTEFRVCPRASRYGRLRHFPLRLARHRMGRRCSGAWTRTRRTGSKARWVANYPTPDGAASKFDAATLHHIEPPADPVRSQRKRERSLAGLAPTERLGRPWGRPWLHGPILQSAGRGPRSSRRRHTGTRGSYRRRSCARSLDCAF